MSSATSLPFGLNDTAVRTTLAAGITSTDTSVDVGEVTNPPSVPFLIAVFVDQSPLREDDMEIMEVTSISGTTLTVNRGAKGTTAQSFSNGDKVFVGVLPSDVFDRDPAGILSSEGEIITADANADPTNVSAGSDGDVLQMSGSQPTFAPSAAAWSQISKTVISSRVSSVEFTSGIDSNNDEYRILVSGLTFKSGASLSLRVSFSNIFQSGVAAYEYAYIRGASSDSNIKYRSGNPSNKVEVFPNAFDGHLNGMIGFSEPDVTAKKSFFYQFAESAGHEFSMGAGATNFDEAIDGVKLLGSADIKQGIISLIAR